MKTQFFLFIYTIIIWYCIGALWIMRIYLININEGELKNNTFIFSDKIKTFFKRFLLMPLIASLFSPIILIFFHSDELPIGMLYTVVLLASFIIYYSLKIILPLWNMKSNTKNFYEEINNLQKRYLQVNIFFTILGICVGYLLWKTMNNYN